ncbi:proline-rich receptor-like protein kinase PERK9 [Musa acuminata AAA Group]|uniref:proline-rich receptor-like protein kinase PERK9 n=1 Tax=Musa acuminata AAA Group TaxID=214697 RepID=UPI0031DF3F66
MASALVREAPPPPVIGKVGRYTVFITPPRTPKPSEALEPQGASLGKVAPFPEKATYSPSPKLPETPRSQSASPGKVTPLPEKSVPSLFTVPASMPPVQVPPLQFDKPATKSSGSVFGFFWDAVAKVQDVHSSFDERLADWFGLDQSKYQWALNDYYENNGKEKEVGKPKEVVSKELAA